MRLIAGSLLTAVRRRRPAVLRARREPYRRHVNVSGGLLMIRSDARQSGQDLHAVAEIAAELHALEDDLVVAVEGRDLRPSIAGDERGRRNLHQIGVGRNLEMHIAVTAAEEFSGGIVGLQLNLHAVRSWIDRLGGMRQRRVELHARDIAAFRMSLSCRA